MRVVESNSLVARLTGAKPVVLAKDLSCGYFLLQRVKDGGLFVEVRPGSNKDHARTWAEQKVTEIML